jgi:hypothetical protein
MLEEWGERQLFGIHLDVISAALRKEPVFIYISILQSQHSTFLHLVNTWHPHTEREEDLTGPYAYLANKWIAFDDDTSLKIKVGGRFQVFLKLERVVFYTRIHCKKRLAIFPSPSRDVTNIKYSWPGRVCLLISRLGTGKSITFFTV